MLNLGAGRPIVQVKKKAAYPWYIYLIMNISRKSPLSG